VTTLVDRTTLPWFDSMTAPVHQSADPISLEKV